MHQDTDQAAILPIKAQQELLSVAKLIPDTRQSFELKLQEPRSTYGMNPTQPTMHFVTTVKSLFIRRIN